MKVATIYRNYYNQGELNRFEREGALLNKSGLLYKQMKEEFDIVPEYVLRDNQWRPVYIYLPSAKLKFVCKLLEWRWETFRNIKHCEINKIETPEEEAGVRGVKRSVAQYTMDGQLVAVFPSLAAASRETGVNSTGISRACRNQADRAGKFKWKLVHESEVANNA